MPTTAPMRAAAIDIGTNSVLLLVAERDANGVLSVLEERATVTRLGEGVDRTRELRKEAIERTIGCLRTYAERVRALGVTELAMVGTSAMRDATNGPAFREDIAFLFGVPVRTLSGAEEAELTFRGALSGLTVPREDATVFDIGGGSTEVVTDRAADGESYAHSFDIGSVRLHERHLRTDPPTLPEIDALRADAKSILAPLADAKNARSAHVVGVAGTVTTLAAVHGSIAPYDGAKVHGYELNRGEVERVAKRLAGMPLSERQVVPGLDPKRADVIVAGAYVTLAVMDALAAERIIVSDRGVRWGLIETLLPPARPAT
ncbi:MAG: Ppx/GppA phosphatase family protein [Polyangiaceae bacterium]